MADKMILVTEEPRGASQLIEVPVTANGLGKVQLPVVQQLQNDTTQKVIIKAIRVVPVSVLSNAPTQGGANAPLTELVKMTLTLYSQGWEKGQLIPVASLIDVFIEGSGTPWKAKTARLDDWTNVDWNKSFLQFANGTVSAGAAYTVIFEVEYQRLDMNGQPMNGVN